MSVLKNKRSLSDLEFYRNGILLRKELTDLLLRDFGIRDKVRKATSITSKMADKDAELFESLLNKYEVTNIIEEYPEWLIDKFRTNILNICHSLIMNITAANTIYPTNESEYYDRRNFQNHAIGNCEQLLQEMQYIISIIPVDINKFLPHVQMIKKEIQLLRGWRKSDNRLLKGIRKEKGSKKDSKTKDDKSQTITKKDNKQEIVNDKEKK